MLFKQTVWISVCVSVDVQCVGYLAPGDALSVVCSSQTAHLPSPVSPTPAEPWRDCVGLQLTTGFGDPPTD